MTKLKLLIADDQVLLADGLRTVLELEPGLDVVGVVHSGDEAVRGVMELQPDLVLMDIQMPGISGLECLRQIKAHRPETSVLMLTTFGDDEYIIEALAAGAAGFVLKDIQMDRLVDVIRHAAQGYVMLPAAIAARVADALAMLRPPTIGRKHGAGEGDLSVREREVAVLLMNGLPNRIIARRLNISEGTAKNYISMIYEKLGTSDRIRAIALLRKDLARV